jgi:hypothetical protein
MRLTLRLGDLPGTESFSDRGSRDRGERKIPIGCRARSSCVPLGAGVMMDPSQSAKMVFSP